MGKERSEDEIHSVLAEMGFDDLKQHSAVSTPPICPSSSYFRALVLIGTDGHEQHGAVCMPPISQSFSPHRALVPIGADGQQQHRAFSPTPTCHFLPPPHGPSYGRHQWPAAALCGWNAPICASLTPQSSLTGRYRKRAATWPGTVFSLLYLPLIPQSPLKDCYGQLAATLHGPNAAKLSIPDTPYIHLKVISMASKYLARSFCGQPVSSSHPTELMPRLVSTDRCDMTQSL